MVRTVFDRRRCEPMKAIAIRQSGDSSGSYERAEEPTRRLSRFTVYVKYPLDPAAGALDVDGLADVEGSIEEIDVNATDEDDAVLIARAALDRDYCTGGTVVGVEERFGWYL
jgi:hypothetical protein